MTKESAMSENQNNTTNVRVEHSSGIGITVAVIGWLAGIVLAKGGYAIIATVFPPYGWYLAVERVMQALGLAP